MSENELTTLKTWTEIASHVATSVALVVAVYQAMKLRAENRARFWLELRKMFAEHDEVHFRLRGGGWPEGHTGPSTSQEWAKVESYMGLFEHCNRMLEEGLIDLETFRHIYKYRVQNILNNQTIVQAKLNKANRDNWKDFVDLAENRLGLRIPEFVDVRSCRH
jgi:hypothetical protein